MPLSRLNLNRRGPWVLGSGAGSPDSCTLRLSRSASAASTTKTLLSPFRMCDIALSSAIPERKSLLTCLLYTSDAADDLLCVDLGGRRIIKKKKKKIKKSSIQ